jgi:hypothetical protein
MRKFLYYKLGDKLLSNNVPEFYVQVLKQWYSIYCKSPEEVENVLEESLWYNQFITIDGKPVYNKYWSDKGINYINDIIDKNGKFLDIIEINKKYDCAINDFQYMQLKHAIPKEWKIHLREKEHITKDQDYNDYPVVALNNKKMDLRTITCKEVYKHLINLVSKTPTAVQKWCEMYETLNEIDWKLIFQTLYNIVRETKLQSFQYKILNRIFPCNHWVSKWNQVCQHFAHIVEKMTP